LDTALSYIKTILGIDELPNSSQVHILRQWWVSVIFYYILILIVSNLIFLREFFNSIPQYVVGHYDKVKQIRSYIQDNKLGLELIGASFDGISVNDCIHNSIRTVNQMTLK
jgi:oxygen-dependent protoporphyrinogen oxidase